MAVEWAIQACSLDQFQTSTSNPPAYEPGWGRERLPSKTRGIRETSLGKDFTERIKEKEISRQISTLYRAFNTRYTDCKTRIFSIVFRTRAVFKRTQICRGFNVHDLITCESKVQVVVRPRELVSFDPWHVTRSPPIGKRI